MKTAVLYARVSSKEQEREGYSIPAQIHLCKEYAEKNNIIIDKIFTESETAKRAGRKAFNQMLSYIKENGVRTILVEKTDRLYRNFKDYVLLEDYDLEIHFVKEGSILSKESKSHDKFIHGIKVLMAKNYIDNLSEEVKKGLREKVESGIYPQKAPIGYKNVNIDGHKEIAIDEEKAPFIKRLFNLYVYGYSLNECRKILNSEGLYNNTKPYSKSRLAEILKDIFYIGKFKYKGLIYEGKHEPLIDIDLFNSVQKRLREYTKTRSHDIEFDYAGLIRCGHCGCQMTAELKKGKYIYYHCTGNKGGNCKRKNIRQELIDEVIEELVERIAKAIPDNLLDDIKQVLKETHREQTEYESNCLDSLTKQLKRLNRRINLLYEDKLDGVISEEMWEERNRAWNKEKYQIEVKIESMRKNSENFYSYSNLLLNLAKDAPQLIKSLHGKRKQQLVKMLCSNLSYKDEKLSIMLNSTFDLILNSPFSENGGR